MEESHPIVQLAFTELNCFRKKNLTPEDKDRIIELYNDLKNDPDVQPGPYSDGRMVRKFNALEKIVLNLS